MPLGKFYLNFLLLKINLILNLKKSIIFSRQMDFCNNSQATFYIGSLILCIEYLHSLRIVYRDLKPENIMINEKGDLRLIDMGTAKVLKAKQGMSRTFTILGTPHYMAPEIL